MMQSLRMLGWTGGLVCFLMIFDLPVAVGESRYDVKVVQDGVLRIDRWTGAISFCRPIKNIWHCRTAMDDLEPYHNEIARLRAKNRELKKRTGRRIDHLGKELSVSLERFLSFMTMIKAKTAGDH